MVQVGRYAHLWHEVRQAHMQCNRSRKNKKLEKWQLEVNKSSEESEAEREREREEKAANNKKPRALNYSHGGKQEWVICSTIGSKVVTTNIRN